MDAWLDKGATSHTTARSPVNARWMNVSRSKNSDTEDYVYCVILHNKLLGDLTFSGVGAEIETAFAAAYLNLEEAIS